MDFQNCAWFLILAARPWRGPKMHFCSETEQLFQDRQEYRDRFAGQSFGRSEHACSAQIESRPVLLAVGEVHHGCRRLSDVPRGNIHDRGLHHVGVAARGRPVVRNCANLQLIPGAGRS